MSNTITTSAAAGAAAPALAPNSQPTPLSPRVPFPTNVSLEELEENLFHMVVETDHDKILENPSTKIVDCYVRYKLGIPNGYQAAFSIFEQEDMSVGKVKMFGESLFEKIPEEEIKKHFPIGNINAMYSYLFFLLKKHYNVTTESKEFNKYNWSRMQLEGFFELAKNSREIAVKFTNQHRMIPYTETKLGFGLNLLDLKQTDETSLDEHFQLGPKFLEIVFKYCFLNDQFPLFFEKGFELKEGEGSYQNRYNTLSNFVIENALN